MRKFGTTLRKRIWPTSRGLFTTESQISRQVNAIQLFRAVQYQHIRNTRAIKLLTQISNVDIVAEAVTKAPVS